jgi:Na+/H+ antiporter NhaD/arsenite permease-like protein
VAPGTPADGQRPARVPVVRDLSGAEQLAARLDRPMGALGLVFLLLVLGQSLAKDPGLVTVLFATLAGALGAYFLERRNEREEAG